MEPKSKSVSLPPEKRINMKFVSIDVETTLNGNEDIGLAHPMSPDNRVVLYGVGIESKETITEEPYDVYEVLNTQKTLHSKDFIVCGHNISFDLMYLYKSHVYLKPFLQSCVIWDTQLAEYILTGQRSKFSSLDELCIKYGYPVKDDKIKKYFQAGLGSDKIPREELEPYLRNDLQVTRNIAELQYKTAVISGMLTLIETQMQALHATTEMMYNGLCIDQEVLAKYTVEVVNEYVDCKLNLEEMCSGTSVEDINSPKQWSTYFFGGSKKVKEKEAVGLFKNGNTKYKTVEKIVPIEGAVKYVPDPDKVSSKTGQVSVDDAVLKDMSDHILDKTEKERIKSLLQYRELSKQLSTYVQGLSRHVIGKEGEKLGFIHGKLNHTATVTGRLSSTNPNLQNISNNPIKQIFVSRWGSDGVIVECDFNQLEVVALAHITRDKQLIKDISSGVDIHSALYNAMFGRMPTKEERKPFKARTFQLIYGAGAKAISKQAGCSLDEAKKFVAVFYTRYPQVAEWHMKFAATIEKLAVHGTDATTGLKNKFKTATFQAETGRMFVFNEYYSDSEWSTRSFSFSPTEMKNYPVQGLATGDIVPMMLGVLFRKLRGRNDLLLVNTIHDSIMFDVKKEILGEFLLEVTETLKNTHVFYEKTFKTPLALKLNAGASVGYNWFEMKEV
jgi:DNA polymerase I-like protein with 3'-5' exonuclease and polymerase domains